MGAEACADSLVLSIFTIINRVLLIAKIAVPLIIIVTTIIDIIKDVTGGEVKYKTTLDRVKYRLFAAVLVFFIPNFIGAIFRAVDTDYSTNNLECLLHVTNKDVQSARIAEISEKIEAVSHAIKTGGKFSQTDINEIYALLGNIDDEELVEKYKQDLEEVQELIDIETEKIVEAEKDARKERQRIKEQRILEDAGIDLTLGESKSGVSILNHNKAFTGAIIKYYSQSSKGPYGAVNYTYKGKNYTYNAAGCGCGYMSISMIIDSLTGSNLTPKGVIQDFSPNVYAGASNESSGFAQFCPIYDGTIKDSTGKINKDYGIEVKEIFTHGRHRGIQSSQDKEKYFGLIKEYLKNGYSIITLIPGHYVVMGAIDIDGYISFYDPSNSNNNGWFTIDTIYNNHYNHANICVENKSCGFIFAVAYKGSESISTLGEYYKKIGASKIGKNVTRPNEYEQ